MPSSSKKGLIQYDFTSKDFSSSSVIYNNILKIGLNCRRFHKDIFYTFSERLKGFSQCTNLGLHNNLYHIVKTNRWK